MTEPTAKIKFTYKDYRSLPESEIKRYELMEGDLVTLPSPGLKHQIISRNLEFILYRFVQEKNLGNRHPRPS